MVTDYWMFVIAIVYVIFRDGLFKDANELQEMYYPVFWELDLGIYLYKYNSFIFQTLTNNIFLSAYLSIDKCEYWYHSCVYAKYEAPDTQMKLLESARLAFPSVSSRYAKLTKPSPGFSVIFIFSFGVELLIRKDVNLY